MAVHDTAGELGYARARRAAREWIDAYRPLGQPYPAVCRSCGATEWRGEWRWGGPVPGLPPVLCPACARQRDGVAAHVLALRGDFAPHWDELRHLVADVERVVIRSQPLERVMNVEIGEHEVLVPTTGVNVARQLAAAIVRRWRHGVRLTFGERTTTVTWLSARPVR